MQDQGWDDEGLEDLARTGGGDRIEDLARPAGWEPGPTEAAKLVHEITLGLGERPGRLEIVGDDRDMAWLVRDGVRISWFNMRTAERFSAERRTQLVGAFRDLVRRYDELRPMIDGLEVGRRYRVEYRNKELRRIFRVKGELRSVSEFRHAEGVSGSGWTLTLQTKPAIGRPGTFHIDSSVVVAVRPG